MSPLKDPDETRAGDWFATWTRGEFWVLDPQPSEIRIMDISHALSLACRYAGHVSKLYSVAEHSVRVSNIVPPEHALAALLHDASEAYLGDMLGPVKRLPEMAGYKAIEKRLQAAIYQRFGCPAEEHPEIKKADLILLATEIRDLHPFPARRQRRWEEMTRDALPEHILEMTSEQAERAFNHRFVELYSIPKAYPEGLEE